MTRKMANEKAPSEFSSLTKVASAVLLAMAVAKPASAVEFDLGSGWAGSFDSTFTIGTSFRIEDIDPNNVGRYNNQTFLIPGQFGPTDIDPIVGRWSNNGDDGNLNFEEGVISQIFKAVHELDLRYEDQFGAFVRGRYFYDAELMDNDRDFRQLTDSALDQHGSDAELLDAYIWASFDIGDRAAQVRVGEMVINWGESTFIQHSISEANPLDAAVLRVPGAELREAFIPIQTLWGTIDLGENASLEAYVQFEWEETRIDAPGTYFSGNDFIGAGGDIIWLGFSQVPDLTNSAYTAEDVARAAWAAQGVDNPSALQLGTSAAIVSGFTNLNRAVRLDDQRAEDDGQFGVRLGWYSEMLNNTDFGFYYVNYHSKRPIISAYAHDGASVKGFVEYIEDIQMYGFSFNTVIPSGWLQGLSIAGEISYRQDEPLQIDDVEILFEATENLGTATPPGTSQIAPDFIYGPGDLISGYRLFDTWQFQATFTQLLGPTLGADQVAVLLEVGATSIPDLPDQSELRFEAPGTARSGNAARDGRGAGYIDPTSACTSVDFTTGAPIRVECEGVETNSFGEDFSAGYRLLVRGEYNNAFAGWNAQPRLVFQHDVTGTTPLPIANFVEGRKSLGLGLKFDYQKVWQVDFAANLYMGAGTANSLIDRDFVSVSVSYSI